MYTLKSNKDENVYRFAVRGNKDRQIIRLRERETEIERETERERETEGEKERARETERE